MAYIEGRDYVDVEHCPVFYPTEEEFQSFSKYVEKCISGIGSLGLLKIVPPKTWVARKEGYSKLKFEVKKPIE